ncbi:hypothetical protein ACFY7A_14895 [Streptomyces longwoodensis]|uniref:hypothetical protein n=1 Tax=Streptomyces longwoodensis TaxID=68231 RepID=UPI0036B8B6E2
MLTRLAINGTHRPSVTVRGARMRLRKRATVVVVLSSAVLTALAPQALAAPMPWETSRTPAPTQHVPPRAADGGPAITLCAPPCYQ